VIKMKKLKFIVEKNADGYWAHREEPGNNLIAAMGETLSQLRAEIVTAYNLYQDNEKKKITEEQISLDFDLPSFFKLYKEINATGIGRRIGMQKSLISEYVNGKKKPSEKQKQKILDGIKSLVKELSEIEELV
jgi:hypothetical protein